MQNQREADKIEKQISPNKPQLNKHRFDSETYDSSKKDIDISETDKIQKKSIDFFPKKMNIEKIDNPLDVHRKFTVEKKLMIKDFVPQLRPIEIHVIPSKLRLNKKGFKDLKRNKNNKILLNSNKYYISCPNSDEEGDSDQYDSSKENHISVNEIKNDNISNSIFTFEDEKKIDIKETRKTLQKTKFKIENIPKVQSKNNFAIKSQFNKDLNLGISSDSDLYDIDEIDNYSLKEYEDKDTDENKRKTNINENNIKRNRTHSFTILEMLQKRFKLEEE